MNLFLNDSKNWTCFFFQKKMTQRIEHFFWFNSKNWTPFNLSKCNSENWICFYMTQRIEFFQYDSQNWTFFFWKRLTELNFIYFFWIRLTELNFFSLNMTKELDSYFLNMTQGIEPLISWIWRKELNRLIFEYTQRIELFLHRTQRIEIIFERLKELNLFFWLKECNFFWIWLIDLNFFFEKKTMTQRNELFFFFDITQRIEPLEKTKLWFKELNLFLFHSKNWIFSVRLTELNLFSLNMTKELDSYFLNMTQWIEQLNFFNMTQRIGPFVLIWRKELDPFFKYDSKKWTFFKIWLTKLNFWIWPTELNLFFEYDSQNWTFFFNMTERIEPLSKYDSKN